jgi:hypothetical protein
MKLLVEQIREKLQKLTITPEASWPIEMLSNLDISNCLYLELYFGLQRLRNGVPDELGYLSANQMILSHGKIHQVWV